MHRPVASFCADSPPLRPSGCRGAPCRPRPDSNQLGFKHSARPRAKRGYRKLHRYCIPATASSQPTAHQVEEAVEDSQTHPRAGLRAELVDALPNELHLEKRHNNTAYGPRRILQHRALAPVRLHFRGAPLIRRRRMPCTASAAAPPGSRDSLLAFEARMKQARAKTDVQLALGVICATVATQKREDKPPISEVPPVLGTQWGLKYVSRMARSDDGFL